MNKRYQGKKFFFFDYDGTLAPPRTRTIPQSTLETISQLREAGHFVGLATGRLQCNAVDFVKPYGFENIVADGGNSVTLNNELIWMEPLDISMVKRVLYRLEEQSKMWAVTTANEPLRISNNPQFETVAGDYYLPTKYDPNLSIETLSEVYKIYIPAMPGEEETLDLLDAPWVRYTSNTIFIEPMNKAVGIKKIVDYYNGSYSDVVVFGDGKNDVTMFLPEWLSIAMGNAREVLKERADYITSDCDKDGIMLACKHFGWIE